MENKQVYTIVVSSCLLGNHCKYNGKHNLNTSLVEWLKGHHVIEVCPEVAGGLSTPRPPAEIRDGKVWDIDGQCVQKNYEYGTFKELGKLKGQEIDLVILQSRSPSCGVQQVYDGTFGGVLIKGHGIFAKAVLEKGYHVIDVSEFEDVRQAIKRIEEMEALYNDCISREEIDFKKRSILEAYYTSSTWLSDYDLMHEHKLPKRLRCGVLSEDAIDDLLSA